jgi:cytochrome c oxidase subunit II
MQGGGPSWKGIFGHMEKMNDGKEFMVDENYLRESMMVPSAKVVAGYDNIMPVFQGLLREREISALIQFIKAQK